MNQWEEQAWEALKDVLDPELGIDIVSLGLVYEIIVLPPRAHVRMTLTTKGCPLHDSIREAVHYALMCIEEVRDVEVELVWTPAWTADKMAPEAKKSLGWG